MSQNSCPHTGISFVPCAVTCAVPRMAAFTRAEGYLPPSSLLRRVRFEGGTFSALAAGPSPLPFSPWHTAQYALYMACPETGDVDLMGTCLTTVLVFSSACMANANSSNPPIIQSSFFADI